MACVASSIARPGRSQHMNHPNTAEFDTILFEFDLCLSSIGQTDRLGVIFDRINGY